MLPLKQVLHWIFFDAETNCKLTFFIKKKDRLTLKYGSEQIFKYIKILKNLQTNI